MGTKTDAYKMRREAEEQRLRENNELLYGFFGRKAEPIREVQQRLHVQLQARAINNMAAEIAELKATTN